MWAFLSNLVTLLVAAFKAWHDEKLRSEGRQEAIKKAEADAKETESVASAAASDPAVIERVRSRWDRARNDPRTPNG